MAGGGVATQHVITDLRRIHGSNALLIYEIGSVVLDCKTLRANRLFDVLLSCSQSQCFVPGWFT